MFHPSVRFLQAFSAIRKTIFERFLPLQKASQAPHLVHAGVCSHQLELVDVERGDPAGVAVPAGPVVERGGDASHGELAILLLLLLFLICFLLLLFLLLLVLRGQNLVHGEERDAAVPAVGEAPESQDEVAAAEAGGEHAGVVVVRDDLVAPHPAEKKNKISFSALHSASMVSTRAGNLV